MLLGVFVVVIWSTNLKLEVHCVCIHKQNCTVEKLSDIQFTNIVMILSVFPSKSMGSNWKYTAAFEAIIIIKKIKYAIAT